MIKVRMPYRQRNKIDLSNNTATAQVYNRVPRRKPCSQQFLDFIERIIARRDDLHRARPCPATIRDPGDFRK